MARKKVLTQPAFSSWSDVDTAMRLIGEYEGFLEELQVDLNRQIGTIKETADRQAQPIHNKIKKLEMDIREYVGLNRIELDGKTKQLSFGKTGYRLSSRLVTPKVAEVLEALKRNDMLDCITIKESINKDILRQRTTDDILKVGAYMKSDDEFWYEVDKAKLQAKE